MSHSSLSASFKQRHNAARPGAAKAAPPRWSCSQRPGWLKAFSLSLLLVGMFFMLVGTPLAHALPLEDSFAPLPADPDQAYPYYFSFHGGWIQQHPRVYLVFWGPKWASDPAHLQIKSNVEQVFGELAGSQYNNILRQYSNTNDSNADDFVHNDVQWKGSWVDTSVPIAGLFIGLDNLSGGEIQDEAVKAFNHWGLAQDKNTQIIVFPQQGSTYRSYGPIDMTGGACGMHSYTSDYQLAYGWVRYAADGQCGFTGDLSGDMVWTAVHEYSETATDPHVYLSTVSPTAVTGSGWNTGTGFTPQEAADLCENYSPGYNSADSRIDVWDGSTSQFYKNSSGLYLPWPYYQSVSSGSSFTLPLLWSAEANGWGATTSRNGCVMSRGQEYTSADHTAPFNYKHTVQGAILSYYQSLGATSSFLGVPMSEEIPIAGGHVSYFQGTGCTSNNQGSAIYDGPGAGIHTVKGCIYQIYYAMGGPNSFLGFPTSNETAIAGGHFNTFQGTACGSQSYGAIYDGPGAGIHEVHGCIDQVYQSFEGANGALSFPTSDETSIAGGRVSYFYGTGCTSNNQGSAIYSAGGIGTYEVQGCIYQYYAGLGGPLSPLFFPTSDEVSIAGGHVTYFAGTGCTSNDQGSAIYDGPGAGVHAVKGCIFQYYLGVNGPGSFLGFPKSDETAIAGGHVSYFYGTGCTSNNQGSGIYDGPGAGIHSVKGCIYDYYRHKLSDNLDGPNSFLGFPVTDEMAVTSSYGVGGHESDFQSGTIIDGSGTGTHEVHGGIYHTYVNWGKAGGKLGFPLSDEYTNSAGNRESDFEGGTIVWANGTATVTLNCLGQGKCI